MTDLEITRLCAEAMGYTYRIQNRNDHYSEAVYITQHGDDCFRYNPLHDDAQAMALVKKFQMDVDFCTNQWRASWYNVRGKECTRWKQAVNNDLNRAICECVAKMQAEK